MPQGQKIVVAKGACRSLPSCNSCLGNGDAVHLTVITSPAKKPVTGSQPADLWWKVGSAAVQLPFQLVLLQNKLSGWALKKEQEASHAP